MSGYRFYGWETADAPAVTNEYPGICTPVDLYDALSRLWSADTCAPRMRAEWSPDNPTLGQCSITAFLTQDIFGGKVYGVPLGDGNFHCFNAAWGHVFDLTSEQFGDRRLCYDGCPEQTREVHFAKEEKRQRYEALRAALRELTQTPDWKTLRTEEDRIRAGLLFCPGDPLLKAIKLKTHKLDLDYNRLYEDETDERNAILSEMLGHIGQGTFLQGPITFHYGKHTHIGDRVFINFNFTCQDDAEVTIGDDCNFGPNVTIVTPMHPMKPDERKAILCSDGVVRRLCWAKPVHIGHDCWFGANVTVCPGVTVGSNCVIGAGAVITKDIPDNSFAAGVPCRVIREIGDADSMKNQPRVLGDYQVL